MDTNKTYPKRRLNTESKYLSLEDFLASYEAKGFHWTLHKNSANLQPWNLKGDMFAKSPTAAQTVTFII